MRKKTKVLVIDDHPFFRRGVVDWLNHQRDLFCCGDADSLATARSTLALSEPEIVLLDLHMRDGSGMDLLRELSRDHPTIAVIILSQSDEDVYAQRALKMGARGYVMKSQATESVLEAIQAVLKGEIYVSRPIAARALHRLMPDPGASLRNLVPLSDRELQVFQLLGGGCSNREIAETLNISIKTVETYREHLKNKLSLPDAEFLIKAAKRWVNEGKFG